MIRRLFKFNKNSTLLLNLDKRAALAIQNHFGLTNYQMLIISWIKGLWTGILLSLVFHYFVMIKYD